MQISRAQFDALVIELTQSVFQQLSPHLRGEAETVLVQTATRGAEPDLLGVYEGVPLIERDADYVGWQADRITLYYQPLIEMCENLDELRHEIRVTLVHEFGHFFGFDEDELEARGWG